MRPVFGSKDKELTMAWFESVTDGGGGACRYKVDIVLTSVGRFTAGGEVRPSPRAKQSSGYHHSRSRGYPDQS